MLRGIRIVMTAFLLCLLLFGCSTKEEDPFGGLQIEPLRDAVVATNAPLPDAAAFLPAELVDTLTQRGISVRYAEPPSPDALGEQTADLVLCAQNGQMRTLSVSYRGIYDNVPPIVTGLRDRSALCGEGVVLRDGVAASDNCLGEVSLTVDASAIDHTREGVYEVQYIVTDRAGNTATYSSPVYIYAAAVTEAQLMEEIDALLARMLSPNMSREDICRSIYASVQASLYYIADTDKSDWVRAAYTSLFVSGNGDCFSYFAATKALLQGAGIPYREIKRSEGYTEDTHYWLIVNIAEDGEAPRWYYFDTTELRQDDYNHSGCLLTAEQVWAYNRVRPYFYQHDDSLLPSIATKIITPTPALGFSGNEYEN